MRGEREHLPERPMNWCFPVPYPITWQPLRDLLKIMTENYWTCTKKAFQSVVHLYPWYICYRITTFYKAIPPAPLQLIIFILFCFLYFSIFPPKNGPHMAPISTYIDLPTSSFTPPHFCCFPSLPCLCTICVQTISCFLRLTVFLPNANTYSLGSLLTDRNLPHYQKASRNDFLGPLGQALPLPSHVSLVRPALFRQAVVKNS